MKLNSPIQTVVKYLLGAVVGEGLPLWSGTSFAPEGIAHFGGVEALVDSIASRSTQLPEFLPADSAIRRSSDFMPLLSLVVLFTSLSVFAPLCLSALELRSGLAKPIQSTKNEIP